MNRLTGSHVLNIVENTEIPGRRLQSFLEAIESAMAHPLPEACADADGYVFPGGEPGGGIQRIDPEPELAEIEGWDWQE
jgi:hypothetical protein